MSGILNSLYKKISILITLVFIFNIFSLFNPNSNFNPVEVDAQSISSYLTPEPAKMSDFWDGEAEWKVYNHLEMLYPERWQDPNSPDYYSIIDEGNFLGGTGIASRVQKVGNKLYWFHRIFYSGIPDYPDADPFCSDGTLKLSTAIRESNDNGKTWSKSYEMETFTSSNENEIWGCQFTDGDFFYDEDIDKWFHISQCRNASVGWSGCLATRDGSNPIGKWTWEPDYTINPFELGDLICRSPDIFDLIQGITRRCDSPGWGDEGTYDIVDKIDGYYYMTFHVFKQGFGVRGLVKTLDFKDFERVSTSTSGTLDDAILGNIDQQNWREEWETVATTDVYPGPVGFGTATSYVEDGYTYILAEGFDKNLVCQAGQNWDFGLFRTDDLAKRGWEQLPDGNPFLYSDDLLNFLCTLQYPELYKADDGFIYLIYNYLNGNNVEDTNILRLEKKKNILNNGDFWKCELVDWLNPTGNYPQMVDTIIDSSDLNCRLDLDCDVLVCGSETISQKVNYDISQTSNDQLYFSLKSKINDRGSFVAKVKQYDSGNIVIDESEYHFNNTFQHSKFEEQIFALDQTRSVEVEIIPTYGQAFVDEIILYPNEGLGDFNISALDSQGCSQAQINLGDSVSCRWEIEEFVDDVNTVSASINSGNQTICTIENNLLNFSSEDYAFQSNNGLYSFNSSEREILNADDFFDDTARVIEFLDYDNDGADEILWFDDETFIFTLTEYENNEIFSPITSGQINKDWYISGAGNLGGDADREIVLHNKTDDRVMYFNILPTGLLSSLSYIKDVGNNDYTLDYIDGNAGWQITGLSDYNNDGKDDLVIKNGGITAPVIFNMDDDKILGGTPITGLPSGYENEFWQIVEVGKLSNTTSTGILFEVFSLNQEQRKRVFVEVDSFNNVISSQDVQASHDFDYYPVHMDSDGVVYQDKHARKYIQCDNIDSNDAINGFNSIDLEVDGQNIITQDQVEIVSNTVQIKVLLEGAMINGDGSYLSTMRNSVSVNNNSINNSYVDQVEVDFIDPTNSNSYFSNQYWIDVMGNLIDKTTLSTQISIPSVMTGENFVVNIKHRNHINIGSNQVFFGGSNHVIDFTQVDTSINSNQEALPDGRFAMKQGDINGDGIRNANDRNLIVAADSALFAYDNLDLNMDGVINSSDRNIGVSNSTAIEWLN